MSQMTIIAPQTGAVTSQAKFLVKRDDVPLTIQAPGLAGSEEVDVFQYVNGAWHTVYKDGAALVLTATKTDFAVYSPIILGFKKDATAASVGVFAEDGNY